MASKQCYLHNSNYLYTPQSYTYLRIQLNQRWRLLWADIAPVWETLCKLYQRRHIPLLVANIFHLHSQASIVYFLPRYVAIWKEPEDLQFFFKSMWISAPLKYKPSMPFWLKSKDLIWSCHIVKVVVQRLIWLD